MRHIVGFASLALALLGCGADTHHHETAAGNVIDSVLPMDVMLARFRKDLPEPTALHGALESRDTLVRRVVSALEANDTLAFAQLAVNAAEWAWLFFPTDLLSRPPYELPPGLAWFQLQETNRQGVFRALRTFGGQQLEYRGYECAEQPTVEGQNRIWIGCRVLLARDGAETAPVRLFSAILERGNRFLVLSYANDF
jgi:hypothetical protein